MKLIIVNKKLVTRIIYRIMLLFVFGATFYYASQDAIGVSSLPIKNMVVIIDPGHGGRDSGALGVSGTEEDNINLNIALKLRRLIEQAGGVALMIREDDTGLYDETKKKGRKAEDLRNRQELLNNSNADIFVAIHLNSFPQSQYYGAQTFYKSTDDKSRKLAEYIQTEMRSVIDNENKRKSKAKNDVYIFKGNKIPGVLVECGFLSNYEEEQLLKQDHYQEKLAWGSFLL